MTNEYLHNLYLESVPELLRADTIVPDLRTLRMFAKFVERDTRHACAEAAQNAVTQRWFHGNHRQLASDVYSACMNTQVVKDA